MYQTSLWKLVKSEPLARLAIAIPAFGTLVGSAFMGMGAVAPCLVTDAIGLLLGLIVLIALVLKVLWIEHLLMAGEELEGKVTGLKDNPGIVLAQTTQLEYHYTYEGIQYKKSVTVHNPSNDLFDSATVVIDPRCPDNSIIRELYCVPS